MKVKYCLGSNYSAKGFYYCLWGKTYAPHAALEWGTAAATQKSRPKARIVVQVLSMCVENSIGYLSITSPIIRRLKACIEFIFVAVAREKSWDFAWNLEVFLWNSEIWSLCSETLRLCSKSWVSLPNSESWEVCCQSPPLQIFWISHWVSRRKRIEKQGHSYHWGGGGSCLLTSKVHELSATSANSK